MEIVREILSYILNAFTGIIFGAFITFWGISRTYKLVKIEKDEPVEEDIEGMDNENDYYVLLPDATESIIVCVEEPLEVGHTINYEGNWYEVESVEHIVNGHTTFKLKYA